MQFIKTHIQGNYLYRVGLRGRWVTLYLHRYGGAQEKSEHFHQHPWRWAISLLLKGRFDDEMEEEAVICRRWAPSLSVYPRGMRHRVRNAKPGSLSLFIGIDRTQESMDGAKVQCLEGYCHYTELHGDVDYPQKPRKPFPPPPGLIPPPPPPPPAPRPTNPDLDYVPRAEE